jgi:hypothetical protein
VRSVKTTKIWSHTTRAPSAPRKCRRASFVPPRICSYTCTPCTPSSCAYFSCDKSTHTHARAHARRRTHMHAHLIETICYLRPKVLNVGFVCASSIARPCLLSILQLKQQRTHNTGPQGTATSRTRYSKAIYALAYSGARTAGPASGTLPRPTHTAQR